MAIRIVHLETFTILNPNECILIDDEEPETRALLEQIGDRLVALSGYGADLRTEDINVDLSFDEDDEPVLPPEGSR